MADLKLTLACGDYEITRPLTDGSVKAEGIEFVPDTRYGAKERHWAMAKEDAYDICEFNAPAYVMARDRGRAWTALPVFAHRRFRHGAMYINTGKAIAGPQDLAGRKVGVKSWTATAILWMRGILESEHGVPLRSIDWLTDLDDHVEGFSPPQDFRVTRIGADRDIETMLAEGEVDALLHPDIIKPMVDGDPRVARLFPDVRAEQISYYRKTGIFPIMHVLGLRPEIVERHPWVPASLMTAFDKAKALAMRRMDNPRIVPLALWREAWEEQREIFGPDPWEYGLGPANVKNLETLVGYCHAQGLTSRRLTLDELFLNPTAGAKRDGVFRY